MSSLAYIGQQVFVRIDRPLGCKHPRYEFVYPVNYGYIPGTISGDGEALDAYVLGVSEPIEEFEGECIAVILRKNEEDDKLIVVPVGALFREEDIRVQVSFQEQYFESRIALQHDQAKAAESNVGDGLVPGVLPECLIRSVPASRG